ncbi:hypothetical protein EDD16DRAFT_1424827, partial [Pisolithus croceorrhizus]
YPTIFEIAMDYLPIQATAVPCKCIFASTVSTHTTGGNLIGPTLMEAVQMLKVHLKKKQL